MISNNLPKLQVTPGVRPELRPKISGTLPILVVTVLAGRTVHQVVTFDDLNWLSVCYTLELLGRS